MKKLNLVGEPPFGLLTVMSEAPKKKTATQWHCLCACGGTAICSTNNLRRGVSKSCGCVGKEKIVNRNKQNTTHGMRNSDMYSLWVQLGKYTVCAEWHNNGKLFEQWALDKGWSSGNKYSLLIKDETKPVGPDNCVLHLKTPNLIGVKYNKLLVLNKSDKKGNATYWDCVCVCEQLTTASTRQLLHGFKKSCGCAKTEAVIKRNKDNATHGFHNHPLYRIRRGMINRCSNKSNKYYGAKGVTVCDEWKNEIIPFITWMLQQGWERGMCIHRKHSDKGYSPDNCEVMTRSAHSTLHNNLRGFNTK